MNHIKKKWNKVLSAILSLAIVLSCIPVQPIFAADEITFDCGNAIEMIMEGSQETPLTRNVSIETWIKGMYTEGTFDDTGTVSVEWTTNADTITVVENADNEKSATITAVKKGTADVICTVIYKDGSTEREYEGTIGVTINHNPIQPTLSIIAPESVNYPNIATFKIVTENVSETGQSVKVTFTDDVTPSNTFEFMDDDGNGSIEVSLNPGTYSVVASVDAVYDTDDPTTIFYNAANSASIDYVVGQGEPELTLTVKTEDGSSVTTPATVTLPTEVIFDAILDEGYKQTYNSEITLQVVKESIDSNIPIDKDLNGNEIVLGQACLLPEGKYTVTASVAATDDGKYKDATAEIADLKVEKGTAVLNLTATPEISTTYPTPVIFSVNSIPSLEDTEQKIIVTVTDEEENATTVELGKECKLPAGKYLVKAFAEANDCYKEYTAEIEYVVGKGTATLSFTATKEGTEDSVNSTTVEYPTAVIFEAGTTPDVTETQQSLVLTDANANPIKDSNRNTVTLGKTPWILPVGEHIVKVTASGSDSYNDVSSSVIYTVKKGTPKWEISRGNADENVYVGQEITIDFPIPTNCKGESVPGKYNLILENLDGAEEVEAGQKVILTAKTIDDINIEEIQAKITATFQPSDDNSYINDTTKEISYKIERIPVNVTWNDVQKTYDGTSVYRSVVVEDAEEIGAEPTVTLAPEAANFEGHPELTELPKFENTEYVFAVKDGDNEVSNAGTWKGTIVKESLILSTADSAKFVIKNVEPIDVTVNKVVLDKKNINTTGVIAKGKDYNASSEAEFISVIPTLTDYGNIPNNELSTLVLKYEAHYYDAKGNKMSGNPDHDTTAAAVKFTDIKVEQNGQPVTNYELGADFKIEDLTTTESGAVGFIIKANEEFNVFAELGLQETVEDTFTDPNTTSKQKLKVHWINKLDAEDAKQYTLQSNGYQFSEYKENAVGDSWDWKDTCEFVTEGTQGVLQGNPVKLYAKATAGEKNGLISKGAYVALDTVKPEGQIYAKVTALNQDGVLEENEYEITGLKDNFDIITGDAQSVEVIFEGSDASSKIAKIEWYGTDKAWDTNKELEEQWKDNVENPLGIFTGNEGKEEKAASIEETLQIVNDESEFKDLKRFYYAKVTDYAGNISYISSSGVIRDVNVPEATVSLENSDYTFSNKNVYKENVDFKVELSDNGISSGIVSVEAVLRKDGVEEPILVWNTNNDESSSTNSTTISTWKNSEELIAIKALNGLPNPTEDDISDTIKEGMFIEGTLAKLAEANGYTLQVVAVDKAGNESAVSEVKFIIDNEAPTIKLTENSRTTNFETDYYFKARSMTITVKDYTLTTPIADLIKGIDDAKEIRQEPVISEDGLITQEIILEFAEDKNYSTEGEYKFDIEAKDAREEISKNACDDFILDYTAPVYTITDNSKRDEKAYVGDTIDGNAVLYHNDDIEIQFDIEEATTYKDSDITIVVKKKTATSSEDSVVMTWKDGVEKESGTEYHIEHETDTDEAKKQFILTIDGVDTADNDGYTYEIIGTDEAGNTLVAKNSEESTKLGIVHALDVTAPQLTEITYTADGKDATELFQTVTTKDENDKEVVRDYINAPTTMTFTITEHNPTKNQHTITEAGTNAVDPIWQQKKDENEAVIADVYTSAIVVPMRGDKGDEQTITYTIIDKAGNRAVLLKETEDKPEETILRSHKNTQLKDGIFTDKFTVDTVVPTIEYTYLNYNPDRPEIEGIDYFKQDVTVQVTVDEHNFNGLYTKVVLFNESDKTDETNKAKAIIGTNGTSSAEESDWKSDGDIHTKTFTLKGDDKYDITVSGNDCANNAIVLGQATTANNKMSAVQGKADGETKLSVAIDHNLPIICDSGKPLVTISDPSSTTSSGTNTGQDLFGGDVTFKVTVYDPNALKYSSGIDNVVFKVEAENGETSEVIINRAGVSGNHNGVTVTLTNSGIADKLGRGQGNVLVYNVAISSSVYNSNNIKLGVEAEDLATNKAKVEADPISIDTTPPEVRITYDNNDVSNLKYFHETRTATIQVTERNFSDDCMTFTVNGSPVPLAFTQTSTGSGNGDDSIWQATYPFENDDDYTVTGECQDRINNVGIVEFEGQAPEEFTVDKTLPIIEIEFDNNNSFNENYYDAQRTATVIITETNFNPDEVEIIGDGNDAGTAVAYPTLSGWSSAGDVHRATLNYSQDALYTLDVEYTDLATNEAEDIEEEEFTIDNTDPEIIISGVEEQMSYSGEVRPEISFVDNNYDTHTITMTRTERENIGVDVTEAIVGAVGVSIDGTGKGTGSRILEDVEHLEENDGIYTLTVNVVDKAGRSTEEMITYSVNRFGSVYVYSQDLVDILNGYYQEIEGDLYITAYNANQLVDDSTKLEITCDGSLVENQNSTADLASARQATNGGWFEYRFRLDHDDFRKDGCYEIALSDKDEAGNTRTNSDAPVSFYIDATAPMIDSIIGLEESIVNANEHQIGYAISDAIALESVAVYVNDEQVNKITDFENSTAFEGSVTLGAGMRQNVRIVAHDKAGNMVDTAAESFTPAYAFNPEITVSTNFLVRWYANTAAFWGSIGAAAVVSGGAITAGVVRVRKKNKIVEED